MLPKNPKHRQVFASSLAIAEVLFAFTIMHVAFRAFKRFTALGQLETQHAMNFSPGIAMIVVGCAFILLRRGRLQDHGITPAPWWPSVKVTVVFLGIFVAFGVAAMVIGVRSGRAVMDATDAIAIATMNVVAALVLLFVLQRFALRVQRIPNAATIGVLALVVVVAFYPVVARGTPILTQSLHVLWIVIGSAIGEELFFRGYVQTRLNDVFDRPFSLFGVRFGLGLFGAAMLFGVIHVLNPADYFARAYRLNWFHGLTTATSLYFGFLRERTGSIAAPALVHACTNLLGRALR